jgi:hypothetical protein
VYEPGPQGATNYIGAASISDTPKGTGVYVTLSNVFDVFSTVRTVKAKTVGKHTVQKDYEAILHNGKSVPVQLRVVKSFYGKWKIVSESAKSTRPDAETAQWTVNVPAGSDVTLKFSATVEA